MMKINLVFYQSFGLNLSRVLLHRGTEVVARLSVSEECGKQSCAGDCIAVSVPASGLS